MGYAFASLSVVVLTLVMLPFRDEIGIINSLLAFLFLALLLGLRLGTGPSAVGAILSFFAFDYFFIEPYNTLDVANRDHVLALFIYLAVALVASVLIGRLRLRTVMAEQAERRTQLLYDLNRDLVRGSTLDEVLQSIVDSVVSIYGATGSRMLILDDADGLDIRTRAGNADAALTQEARPLATWTIEHRQAAGARSRGRRIRAPHGVGQAPRNLERAREDVLFIPIQTESAVVGTLEIDGRPWGGAFSPDEIALLETFADQAALAVQRGRLMEEALRAEVLEQSNALKSSLIAAVSHDLRTPLTTIKASSSALLDDSMQWDPAVRRDLLTAIDEDADRLTLMVSNLLDLSRIEGGVLKPNLDWHDVAGFFDDLRARTLSILDKGQHALTISLTPETDFPDVCFDYVEIMQVLINLIGNAAKYSHAGTPIVVEAKIDRDMWIVSVTDHGFGIPAHRLPHVFETFYRVNENGPVSGTGIGLAICKGIVDAHEGTIRVRSVVDEGSTVTFALPVAGPGGASSS